MSVFMADWANLLLRWAHLIAGIGWIGTSFYFIALDLSLKKRAGMRKGVSGTAWEVHGGGFYHVEKYSVAPDDLPEDLIWYKWEAYLTWFTGIALLVVQFYLNPAAWLIDPKIMDLQAWQAIAISVASLTAGWFIYDGLCRSPLGKNTTLLAALVFILILAAAYFYTNIFSGRAALIHVGAFIGTAMAANVFGIIIPNQKKITAALLNGERPDPKYGQIGKQRSVHNTYLTLPVLVMMVSGHYPLLTGHPEAWTLVGLIVIGGACLRHFILRHEVGDPLSGYGWTLPVIAVALAGALWLTKPVSRPRLDSQISDATIMTIINKHCASCHAENPANDAFNAPPNGIILLSTDDIRRYAAPIKKTAVDSDDMPLGNETEMTDHERTELGTWLDQQ